MRGGTNALITGALLGILLVSVLIYLTPSTPILQPPADFNPSGTSWNGMSSFVDAEHPQTLQNLSSLPQVGEGFTLAEIGPSINFTPYQSGLVSSFVKSGGTLILADDFGTGNSLLSGMGLGSGFNGSLLTDPLFNFKNSWLVVIPAVRLGNVPSLAFNYATVLNLDDAGTRVLAYSSDFSYLYPGQGETISGSPKGPFPVVAEIPYGRGHVYLISDASVFTNSMIGMNGNLALLRDLSTGTVLLDTSHIAVGAVTVARSFEISVYSVLSMPEVKYSIVLLGLAGILVYRSRPAELKGEDELNYVIREHPEWDAEKLKMLSKEVGKE
jgi:hypothetical protein